METINSYLENIFGALPNTAEMVQLKNNLLGDMEAKYHELRQHGKTENEAIGIVIAEFGNIDEILNEFNIERTQSVDEIMPILSREKASEFLYLTKKQASFIGIGVALIMAGIAILIGLGTILSSIDILNHDNFIQIIPVIALLILIIPAVALFIYSGNMVEQYNFIKEGFFQLNTNTKNSLEEEFYGYKKQHTLTIIIGVSLCIFSVVLFLFVAVLGDIFVAFGICVMLLGITVAVFIFIQYESTDTAYKQLLKLEDYNPDRKKANNLIGVIASVIWPVTVCVFLVWGFFFDGWGIAWIVFPIVGILFGALSSAIDGGVKK